MREKYLTPKILREKVEYIIYTACKTRTITVKTACVLPVTIGGVTEMVRFLVSDELRTDVTLGRTWLKTQKAVYDHDLDCLYIGDGMRRRVFLSSNNDASPECNAPENFFEEVQHGFPREYAPRLQHLLREYADIFFRAGPLQQTPYVTHDIELMKNEPFRIPPYRHSAEKKRLIQKQVREMLADGLIEPSFSPYSSPIVMDKKKDGNFRFCIDFRRLNAITKDTAQNLPIIREVIKDIGSAKIFTTLDLKHGYWQIPLTEHAKKYTAFATPDGGLYQWRVMPFGLKNAPGCFNNFITQEVLSGYINEFVRSYLDDFVIYSSSWDEHLAHLSKVFERLRIYKLTCSVKKCFFGKQNLEFLGHEITSEGNRAKPETIRAIQNFPVPQNRKDLRGFLGTCEWLREYIANFTQIALPLTALLSSKQAFVWTSESQRAFENMKRVFNAPLILSRPDPGKIFYIQTDACSTGMGAALYQLDDNGARRIISYASAKFTKTEMRYHSNEQECLAIIWALRKYRHYLEDGRFVLRTDNRALTWLNNVKDGKGKLHRWAMYLKSFDFVIEHVAGKDNQLPDALSRDPGNEQFVYDADALEALLPPERPVMQREIMCASMVAQDLRERIKQAQQEEPLDIKDAERFLQSSQTLQFSDGALFVEEHDRSPRIYVPYCCRDEVIGYFHDDPLACHPGANETLRAVRESHFWPRMREDVRRAVGNCATCLLAKAGRPIAKGVQHFRQPTAPWEIVAIDMMGPYPRTSRGKRFILVATDVMSRWTEAFAVTSSELKIISPTLEREVFMRWGYPRVILSDNAPQFRGINWANQCKSWGAVIHTTPAYHPRANPTERRNQELKKGLRLKIADGRQSDWDLHLPSILFSLRRRNNRITGQSPSQMLLGRNLPRPGEWNFAYNDETQDRIDSARQRQAALTLTETPEDRRPLRVGELVLARNFTQSNAAEGYNAQLAHRWTGPFAVKGVCSNDVYVLERPGREQIKLHISALKKVPQPIPPVENADATRQSVEDISLLDEQEWHHSSTDSRSVPADPPIRAPSPTPTVASAAPPIRTRAEVQPMPSSAQRREPDFPDFAAVAPPQRRRGRPTEEERTKRAEERKRSDYQHRYDLRPRVSC